MEDETRLLPGPIPMARDIGVVQNLYHKIKQLQHLVDTLEHQRAKQQKGNAADIERTEQPYRYA
jgi:hypothetical protein